MAFNSLTYLSLLALVVFIFWQIPHKLRYYLIFLSSLIFYGFWRIDFIFLLLFSTTSTWFLTNIIHNKKIKKEQKKFLVFTLSINLGILFIFKYLIFFSENAIGILNLIGGSFGYLSLKREALQLSFSSKRGGSL